MYATIASPAASFAALAFAALAGSAFASAIAACAPPRPKSFSPASFTKSIRPMLHLLDMLQRHTRSPRS